MSEEDGDLSSRWTSRLGGSPLSIPPICWWWCLIEVYRTGLRSSWVAVPRRTKTGPITHSLDEPGRPPVPARIATSKSWWYFAIMTKFLLWHRICVGNDLASHLLRESSVAVVTLP